MSLRIKYAIVTGAVILALAIGLSWTFVSQTNQWFVENLSEKGLSETDELARKSVPALAHRDTDQFGQLIAARFRDAEVAYLGAIDSEGNVFEEKLRRSRFHAIPPAVLKSAQSAPGPVSLTVADRMLQPTYFFMTPVLDGKESRQDRLGAIVLGISSHFLRRDAQEIFRIILPFAAGAVIVSCVLVFVLLERGLRPLADVARLTAQIAQGDFSQRIKLTRKDEIGVLAQSFNAMAEALEEREAKGREAEKALARKAEELSRSNTELQHFLYIASHDLQEPLRAVASYVQLLARRYKGKLDREADEFIAFAVDGATRMQALINALLDYSRLGTKGKPFEPTNCEKIVQVALKNLQSVVEESKAIVTHDRLPTVMGDAIQLGQLFQNLIANAIKFRGDKPPAIHVWAEPNGKEWRFSVRDCGIGIDPQYFERIFVIFQRLHSKEEYPGTGIGLTLCKKIVERHGGRIWVESEPAKGATFRFTIPV